VFEPTVSRRDAASTIFNLPDYRVIDAVDLPGGQRQVAVASTAPPGCPVCGVISVRVHSRRRQTVRDVPTGGLVQVVWVKRRWFCDEAACPRGTFSESTVQVPARARSTARLREALVHAVIVSGRAAAETARSFAVSWWTVQTALSAVAVLLADVDHLPVRRLGIDEHRYRSVKYFRRPDGTWRRFEPWMTTFVDLDTGQVLGVVDGRDSAGVGSWLAARTPAWRERVQVVAIDPSAAFRKALTEHLPYTSYEFGTVLEDLDLRRSMGRTGICHDCEQNWGPLGRGLTRAYDWPRCLGVDLSASAGWRSTHAPAGREGGDRIGA